MGERLSCLQAVRSIQTDPYPHAWVEQALPDALYEELEATFPEQWMLERIQRLDAGSPTRRLKVAEALQWGDLAPIWVDFLRFHTSPDYLRDVVRLFEPQLLAALGSEQLHQLWQGSVTPRRIPHRLARRDPLAGHPLGPLREGGRDALRVLYHDHELLARNLLGALGHAKIGEPAPVGTSVISECDQRRLPAMAVDSSRRWRCGLARSGRLLHVKDLTAEVARIGARGLVVVVLLAESLLLLLALFRELLGPGAVRDAG